EPGQAEHADPVAVVAPGIIEHVRLAAAGHQLGAQTFAEGEPFEIDGNVEGEPLAARPVIGRPRGNRRIGVTAVIRHAAPRKILSQIAGLWLPLVRACPRWNSGAQRAAPKETIS